LRVESVGFIAGAFGRNASGAIVGLELLLLPLRRGKLGCPRLLGVLAPLVPPYWLGATPVEEMTCGTIRYLGADCELIATPRLVAGMDDGRLRHGLTIYDGGRA
jgi:hypothetical protein